LLFLETDYLLEHFFADIDVPFDCEMLVAQPGDNHVVLTEVYRVSPSLQLQTCLLGNWTPGGTLSWRTQSLYQRRKTLQGLVLKTGTIEVCVALMSNAHVQFLDPPHTEGALTANCKLRRTLGLGIP
jgi:hypothetical protein